MKLCKWHSFYFCIMIVWATGLPALLIVTYNPYKIKCTFIPTYFLTYLNVKTLLLKELLKLNFKNFLSTIFSSLEYPTCN